MLERARRRRSLSGLGEGGSGNDSETAELERTWRRRSWPEPGDGRAGPGLEDGGTGQSSETAKLFWGSETAELFRGSETTKLAGAQSGTGQC